MLNVEQCFSDCINSPVRNVRARVELYDGSTLLHIFKHIDRLREFTVERTGEGKFFGYGICQKLNTKLIDKDRELNITTANTLDVAFGTGCDYVYTFPVFKVTEVHRDENTNELSVTAYDALYEATYHTLSEINIPFPYTIAQLAEACAALLGIPMGADNMTLSDPSFQTVYQDGANFDGTESIREVLNDIAEATQTIYFVNHDWQLTFKRLDASGEPLVTIDKEKYFTLESSTNRRVGAVCHATELGDNIIASMDAAGTTVYIRDNAFWDLRDDITELVDNALAVVGGLTINQFSLDWRGNYLLEIGDKIAIVTKDNDTVYSYLLNDTISFDGSFSQQTQWSYDSDETESESNPTSLGDAVKQTFAKVDKVNKQIDLVVSDIQSNREAISTLQLSTEGIAASVKRVEDDATASYESLNDGINKLTTEVDAKMSAEDVQLRISTALANGVDKVVTSTGFTFDEEGLTISKSGSEMETTITEDGMKVYRDNTAVLTANNMGVEAINLYATTFLIIGTHSRLENYGEDRTGCFWISEG